MANCILAWKNLADSATLSGGDWVSTSPLANLQEKRLADVARSDGVESSATTIIIDLTTLRGFQLIGLFDCTFSLDAQIQIEVSDESDFGNIIYDTDVVDVYPVMYGYVDEENELEWEDDAFWTGKPTEDDLLNYKRNYILITDDIISGQYIRITIFDEDNDDGYIDLGRLFVSPIWQFVVNFGYGATILWEDLSLIDYNLEGSPDEDERGMRRVMTFNLDFMLKNEAFSKAFEMVRRLGITGQLVVVPDKDDSLNSFRQNFLGRIRTPNPLSFSAVNIYSNNFDLEEIL